MLFFFQIRITEIEAYISYLNGANKVLVAHQLVCHKQPKDYSTDPCSQKPFNCLFGGYLNELGSSKGNTADIGENVIRNDKRYRQEKPNHSFENIVHDEVRLDDNKVENHVCPCKLRELELVMPFLERSNKEYKA